MGTFFNPPQIYDAVQRPRLFKLLDDNAHKQNTLVVGQAAQGKSTLVASYLEKSSLPALWFQLSPQDNNHIKLFEKLVHGLAAVCSFSISAEDMIGLRSTLGAQKEGLRHVEALPAIFYELPSGTTIVFDDLQTLDETSVGFLLIKHLANLQLENIRLIFLSRTLPGFDLVRLKMNHCVFIIDNKSLAFTLEETRAYFNKSGNAPPLEVKKIHQVTEGWAGGLTLVSESARQFKDVSHHLPERLSADVFSFFSQEIYSRLDKPIQAFLMKVSIFETIDFESANHIAGIQHSRDILTNLEKRNLFTQRINSDTNAPQFKFHDLFRSFLKKNLSDTWEEDEIKRMNHIAGQFFWEKKDHEQAVNYFITADSLPDIIQIIKIKATDYMIKGKLAEPERWISHIPESFITDDPWLIFFQTMTQRIKGGKKNIKQLEKALILFEKNNDSRGILLSTAYLIEAAVFIRLPSPKILEWICTGENMLKKIGASHRYPWARALLWQLIGLGYIAGDGNIPKGISACRNAILLGRQIQNPELILNASITMTFGCVQAGDFTQARLMLSKIEHMIHSGRHPEYRSLKDIVDIELALKNGQFNTAQRLLSRSETDIEKFGLIFLYPAYIEAKAYHLVYTSQYDGAKQMADHLNDFSILEGNDFYSVISQRLKALAFLYEKDYDAAMTHIKLAVNQLNKAKKGDIHHFLTKQIEGRILFSKQRLKEAEQSLLPSLDYFTQISSDLSIVETAITLGLTLWDKGNENNAFRYLSQGIEKACKNKYNFFPLLNDEMLSRAILILIAQDDNMSAPFNVFSASGLIDEHALALISRCNKKTVLNQISLIMKPLKKKEKLKAKERFHLLYKKLLPKLRITSLGQFYVHSDAEHDSPVLFEGSRPAILLKSIVLHGSKDIPKEILIDDLWPDADARSGEKNFKINLHRLRKTIEPTYEKEFGYSYILQKSGLISLDPDLVYLDTDQFISFGKKALRYEQRDRIEDALEIYDKAIGLYRGDYFVEEPYMEWIQRKRSLYRARYMEMLQKKAMLHEELDQFEPAIRTWQMILQTDPCFEIAYQNLMILYADSGRKSMALDLFEDCKMFLAKELGAKPDAQTTQIYQRILSL